MLRVLWAAVDGLSSHREHMDMQAQICCSLAVIKMPVTSQVTHQVKDHSSFCAIQPNCKRTNISLACRWPAAVHVIHRPQCAPVATAIGDGHGSATYGI